MWGIAVALMIIYIWYNRAPRMPRHCRVNVSKICASAFKAPEPEDLALGGKITITHPDEIFRARDLEANFSILNAGSTADDFLAHRHVVNSRRAEEATINRARFNKYTLRPLYEEELQDHERRVWWEDDSLDMLM